MTLYQAKSMTWKLHACQEIVHDVSFYWQHSFEMELWQLLSHLVLASHDKIVPDCHLDGLLLIHGHHEVRGYLLLHLGDQLYLEVFKPLKLYETVLYSIFDLLKTISILVLRQQVLKTQVSHSL